MHRLRFIVSVLFCWSAVLLAQEKQTLAVMDFDSFGISKSEVQALTNRLRTNLIRLGKYQVIERGLMQQILAEQDFQMLGCTSDECAVEVGQLLNAQFMLAGSIGKVGETWTIDMRIIDVETGAMINSAAFDTKGAIDEVLTIGMPEAARMITGMDEAAIASSRPRLAPAFLNVTSDPTNAELMVDGLGFGKTPVLNLEISPSQPHAVKLFKDGYHTLDTTLTVISNDHFDFNVRLSVLTGWLAITGERGTRVALDGRSQGKLPFRKRELPIGMYDIKIARPEYYALQDTLRILVGSETNYSYTLRRKPKLPALFLSTTMPGAGQLYHGFTAKGLLFLATTAGLGYLGYTSHIAVTDQNKIYSDRLDDYNSEPDPGQQVAKKASVQESFDVMQKEAQTRNAILGGLGAVWVVNIIDIVF